MNRIRVVHLIDNLGLGGAEMMLYKLLSRIDMNRFDSRVISMMPLGPVGEQVATQGLPVYILGMRRGSISVISFIRLVRLLRALKPDVLQTWMSNADFIGLIAGRMAGVKQIIWNIRGAEVAAGDCSQITRLSKMACAHLSSWPTAVISNSIAGRQYHQKIGYHPRRWHLLPNGFDLDTFKPDPEVRNELRSELGIPAEMPLIGTVGRYHPMKDHITFVKAAKLMHEFCPGVHFVMVGAGLTPNNREFKIAASTLFKSDVIHLIGIRFDIPRVLAALDVFALTSQSEGFPNVVGEAMACGVPCVVTETAGDAPLIVGETGLIVPSKDPRILATAWGRLLNMPKVDRCKLGDAARERIHQHFAIQDIVKRYEQLYNSLVNDGYKEK